MGDGKLLLYERHEGRENEPADEIQEKESGEEENGSGHGPKRFWNGT
jgi:hypothetical protein